MPADYQHLAIAPSYPPNSGGSLLWIFFQWVLNLILCLWISGSVDQWISRSVDQLINWLWLKCVFTAWTALSWFCQFCVLIIRLWSMYFWSIHSLLLQLLLSRHRHHPLLCLLYYSVCPWFVWWEVFLLRPRFPVWSNLNYCTVLMTGAGINLKHFKHREWWNRNSFSFVSHFCNLASAILRLKHFKCLPKNIASPRSWALISILLLFFLQWG